MRYKECNIFEYALRYEPVMDSQAGFFARLALRGRGAVLVFLTDEEKPAGCVILNVFEHASYDLAYLYLRPEYRGQGFGVQMTKEACRYAREKGRGVTLRIMADRKEAEALKRIAAEAGMEPGSTTTLFHSCPQDEEDKLRWRQFWEKRGSVLYLYAEKKGYITTDFAHAPKEVLERLKEEAGVKFPAHLNPFRAVTIRDDEFSFLTYNRDGITLTYNTASGYGEGREKRILQETMANRNDMVRTGIFFPALAAFINRTIERECLRVTYTVYDSNRDMIKLTDGFLKGVIHSSGRQEIWRKKFGDI